MCGFYYKTSDINPEELAKKCLKELDIDVEIQSVEEESQDIISPEAFFNNPLTDDWLTAEYEDGEIKRLDVEYSELNKESQIREAKRLQHEKGPFFIEVLEITTSDDKFHISALIEIRGARRQTTGESELFITEITRGVVDNGIEFNEDSSGVEQNAKQDQTRTKAN